MFYLVGEAEICNYVIDKPEKHSFEFPSWFSNNVMKLNEEKCHAMLYGDKLYDHSVNVGQALIKESTTEKLLEVTLQKRLSFETHTQQLYVKASQKLHSLARVSPSWTRKSLYQ